MKKGIIIILIAIITATGLFVFSKEYRKIKNDNHETSAPYTSTVRETTKPKDDKQGVIAECKEANTKIVIKDKAVTLYYGEYSCEMNFRYNNYTTETPEFYYFDFDGDGEKEPVLRFLSFQQKTTDGNGYIKSYALEAYDIMTDADGKNILICRSANQDMWQSVFENYITCELTQLKSCDKILQFAMNNKGEEIVYDKNTGITNNKYSGYVAVAKSPLGEYYTLDKWSKGVGSYNIDKKGNIRLDIQVLVQYKETSFTEQIGKITCTIGMDERHHTFEIIPNKIRFIPDSNRIVADPRRSTNSKWSVEVINRSQAPPKEQNQLTWIEATFDVSSLDGTQDEYFSERESQIKYIDSVVFNQSGVMLTTKENYVFDKRIVNENRMAVEAMLDGKKVYDISYKCSVKQSGNREILTITFDKNYNKNEMHNVKITFA